ncbi:hypothetical protein K493DRAFT_320065 [Basidiobolus meristosporus CBS 931.73]|uniref:DUF952 domain-containing protein n=1 Tax=Basidiobolus meristosporus CBS 931.73 TaxID=1314790 RepID=A0A1Y1XGD2_9FUNG|nr:hypothetical protein K493DRAFT_320065 [Basidiobolus meristosporus CBS 931.73]|eukprot:ORX84787.1 hypothetical protein K493DRAFT_320065 [Basidiobolus meristosporus CBS 931.73]
MNPNYVYKVVLPDVISLNEDPNQAIERSAIDEDTGFIHLALAEQVLDIIQRKFSFFREVWILKIDYSKIVNGTQWEQSKSDTEDQTLFPHYYGELKVNFVVDVLKGRKNGQGDFDFPCEKLVSWSNHI